MLNAYENQALSFSMRHKVAVKSWEEVHQQTTSVSHGLSVALTWE